MFLIDDERGIARLRLAAALPRRGRRRGRTGRGRRRVRRRGRRQARWRLKWFLRLRWLSGRHLRRKQQSGEEEPATHVHQCKPRCFMTSPSRKIDPATTILGDADHAVRSASGSAGSIAIGSAGATRRATAASSCGSADRGFSARATTSDAAAGSNASNMPRASLSRIAAKTSGARMPSRARWRASASAPAGLCAASIVSSLPSASRRVASRPGQDGLCKPSSIALPGIWIPRSCSVSSTRTATAALAR